MLCKTFFAWYNFYIADSLECILFEQAHRLPQLNVHGIRKRPFFYHLKKRYPNTAATVFFHPEHFVTFEVSISSKPCSFFSVSYFSESCSMNLSSGECSTTSVLPVKVLAFIANLRFTWGFDLQRHLGFQSAATPRVSINSFSFVTPSLGFHRSLYYAKSSPPPGAYLHPSDYISPRRPSDIRNFLLKLQNFDCIV